LIARLTQLGAGTIRIVDFAQLVIQDDAPLCAIPLNRDRIQHIAQRRGRRVSQAQLHDESDGVA